MRKPALLCLAVVLGVLVLAGSAVASVTFDPNTGTGFVGKGDVQLALGLNNAQVQKAQLAFSYQEVDWYVVKLEGTLLDGTKYEFTVDLYIPRRTRVNAVVQYDARTRRQITGYKLTGYGETVVEGSLPEIGDAFGEFTVVDILGPATTGQRLFVSDGGAPAPLWP